MGSINVTELKRLLDADPTTVVIDVRTPAEFAGVHIVGARNEPLGDFEPDKLVAAGRLPATGPVHLLCRSGKRAGPAAERFVPAGLGERAVVVEGGTLAWIAAGFPIVRGEPAGIDLERQVRILAGSLVFAGTPLGIFIHRDSCRFRPSSAPD